MDIEFENQKHLLIFYRSDEKSRRTHQDPMFDELTYGDWKNHGATIRKNAEKGSHIFFHTTMDDGMRYITAYFVVSEVLEGHVARSNKHKRKNYKNPHINPPNKATEDKLKYYKDIIIFGDEEKSYHLEKKRIVFDKNLADELIEFEGECPKIKFGQENSKGRMLTELESIAYPTRSIRILTSESARKLYNKIC